jgi:hypothetical protein
MAKLNSFRELKMYQKLRRLNLECIFEGMTK